MRPPAVLFTVLLCALFGANAVAIKIAFNGLGTFTTAALRFAIAAVVLALWIRLRRRALAPPSGLAHQLVVIAAVFTVQLSLVYSGLSKTSASRGTLLINLQPFFLLFFAHFLIPGDRIEVRKLLGLALGFCGLAVVFLERKGVGGDFRVGDLMLLAATVIWAGSIVYLKRVIEHHDPMQIVLYQMVFAVPIFLLEALLWDSRMVFAMNKEVIASLAYQGLVTASFGFVAWNTMLRKYGAVALHSFVFLMPVAGIICAGWLLGEPITAKIVVALALIAVGLLVIHSAKSPPAPVYPIRRTF